MASVKFWDLVKHIFIMNWVIISSGNGLAPVEHQAIIWTNVLSNWTRETNFQWNLDQDIKISFQNNASDNVY